MASGGARVAARQTATARLSARHRVNVTWVSHVPMIPEARAHHELKALRVLVQVAECRARVPTRQLGLARSVAKRYRCAARHGRLDGAVATRTDQRLPAQDSAPRALPQVAKVLTKVLAARQRFPAHRQAKVLLVVFLLEAGATNGAATMIAASLLSLADFVAQHLGMVAAEHVLLRPPAPARLRNHHRALDARPCVTQPRAFVTAVLMPAAAAGATQWQGI